MNLRNNLLNKFFVFRRTWIWEKIIFLAREYFFFWWGPIFFGGVPYPIFFGTNLLVRVKLGYPPNVNFLGKPLLGEKFVEGKRRRIMPSLVATTSALAFTMCVRTHSIRTNLCLRSVQYATMFCYFQNPTINEKLTLDNHVYYICCRQIGEFWGNKIWLSTWKANGYKLIF